MSAADVLDRIGLPATAREVTRDEFLAWPPHLRHASTAANGVHEFVYWTWDEPHASGHPLTVPAPASFAAAERSELLAAKLAGPVSAAGQDARDIAVRALTGAGVAA